MSFPSTVRLLVLSGLIALMSSVAIAQDATPPASHPARPNILFIMTDQQRWDSLGANGNKLVHTPQLDALAAQSANFTHAFVQAPVCVPSRISFFTGRYPHSHRNRVNYTPLDRSEVLMQARLRDAGYATASVGKLHYYPPTPEEALRTGFDSVELHDGVFFTDFWSDYVKWRQQNDPQKKFPYRSVAKDIQPGKNPFRSNVTAEHNDTAWVGERTRVHLKELAHGSKPFFLYASFWKPHSPFEVPEPYASMYDQTNFPLPAHVTQEDLANFPLPLQKLVLRNGPKDMETPHQVLQWMYRSYHGTINQVDGEIGSILRTLEELHLADNTIIVFSSDHGAQMLEHAIMDKNCFYEGSVRVPFMISWPGHIHPAQHAELVEAIDLLPTLFDLIGLPEPAPCEGRSLAPLIAGKDGTYRPRDAVFSENVIPEVITGMPFEKGVGVGGIRHPDAKMVRTARWKYNYYPEGYAELYDLEKDPDESTNLATRPESQAVVVEMKDRLLRWLTTSSEPDQIAPRWLLGDPSK